MTPLCVLVRVGTLQGLETVGNVRAAAVYLATLPADHPKPNPDDGACVVVACPPTHT
jgi:hypothetical protein